MDYVLQCGETAHTKKKKSIHYNDAEDDDGKTDLPTAAPGNDSSKTSSKNR